MDRLLLVVKNFFSKIKTPRAVLFFLALSVLFWVFTKLSKSYTTTLGFSIVYHNLADNQLLYSNQSQTVFAESTASGFRLTKNLVFPPKIQINASSAHFNGTDFFLTQNPLRRSIQSQISKHIQIRQVLVDTFYLQLGIAAQKKVPVRYSSKLSFANGYDLVKPFSLTPDSILVSGPKAVLDSLSIVMTQPVSLKNIDATFSENVGIQFNHPSLKSSTSSIRVRAEVDRFTEKSLIIPIQISNLPSGAQVKLFPPSVSLKFKASFSTIKEIESSDFLITCDYNHIGTHPKLPLIIQDQPNGISRPVLSENTIDYLVKK
ncbi:MAG: YbbR-like domain-containing protein [Flavobacteriaceae bacterium]|nr:YbbR-like domain-containing protein [Flavobacteriaceae bacterium]MDG2315039.1 YbbR-like domain-containing protein [Flavobacteriaceae bacterium]